MELAGVETAPPVVGDSGASMSTGWDPKTMPVTAEYESGFARIFGKRNPTRGRWVYDSQGNAIPADQYVAASATHVPVVSDVYMDGAATADGVDIGSRRKREEYKRRNGVVDSSDVSSTWVRKRREAQDARASEITKQTVAELSNVDRHNLRNAVDQMRKKR